MFPNLLKWRDLTVRESMNSGYVMSRSGRRMLVTNSTGSNSIINFPIQGTGADGFKFALWMLDQKLADLDTKIVHILHDEIIVEANEKIAGKVADILKECMESAFADLIPEFPMVVEPDVRNNWG